MDSRCLQPCSGRDISHLINWLAGRKPIDVHTKVSRVKDVLLALNAGEMASGKVQCSSAKFLPESPWLRGLRFRANLTLLFPDWFLGSAFCFSVSSEEISAVWVWRCQVLPATTVKKCRWPVSSPVAWASVQRNDRVSGQAGNCLFQKGSFQA